MCDLKIGLMGLEFNSENKGCAALAYSFLNIINLISKKNNIKVEIVIVTSLKEETIYFFDDSYIKYSFIKVSFKNIKTIQRTCNSLKTCNMVFDFTEGDSFSDIYGIKRFFKVSFLKQYIIGKKIPLILGPQTYGPYKNYITKKWAKSIIKNSTIVYTRDNKSAEYIYKLSKRKIIECTDIAFALEYKKEVNNNEKIRIGINPSGLLWSGGYTRNNQFNLTVDYIEYCKSVIEYLLSNTKYEIHLIPHVITKEYNHCENDIKVCNLLKEYYTDVIVTKEFKNPIEAKSYIANMEVFIGARMHATIGAFSCGIATIPFSYSRKFEGLYNSIGYPYVIRATKLTTQEAINQTLQYIDNRKELKNKCEQSMIKVNEKLYKFYGEIETILSKK